MKSVTEEQQKYNKQMSENVEKYIWKEARRMKKIKNRRQQQRK